MIKEFEPKSEVNALASMLAGTFIQRRDLQARQLEDGRYLCVREPLLEKHLVAHLNGEITLGTYVLDQDSQARFAVIDADDDLQMAKLADIAKGLAKDETPSYLEASRRGGHLWFFFDKPVPGSTARSFGQSLLESNELADIEFFPKQDKLDDGPGSLIRLPFGVHRKDGQRYGFITPDGDPLAYTFAQQIRLLSSPQTIDPDRIEKAVATIKPETPKNPPAKSEPKGEMLSDQIKSAMPVFNFVSQYVELSPSGRGKCPFHDDQHNSFSVNADKNYWYCFAGCGGGSIIDFWMKFKGVEFKEAIKELAGLFLNPK